MLSINIIAGLMVVVLGAILWVVFDMTNTEHQMVRRVLSEQERSQRVIRMLQSDIGTMQLQFDLVRRKVFPHAKSKR